jgi:outer membrane protein
MRLWSERRRRGGRLLLAAALLAGTLAGLPQTVRAQEDIAYIDSQRVLEQLPEYATVQQRLDRLTRQWEQEIAAQRARVDSLQQEFQARVALYPEEERQRRRQEIRSERQKVEQLRQRYFGPQQGRLYQRQQELMQPIQERVLAVVEEIARAEGYDYVLDKSGQATFMYANPDLDLTGEVLEELGIDVEENERQQAPATASPPEGDGS